MIALPLLAFIIDVKVATPLMTLLSCTIAVSIVAKHWREIQMRNAWRLIVSACVGIPVGIVFLVQVDVRLVKMILAVTVILFTFINLITIKTVRQIHINYALLFGFISGMSGGAYNMSGPPVVLYGSLAHWSPNVFRATIQSYALCTNLFAITGHALAGNITSDVLTYYLFALPIVGCTIWLGSCLHAIIPGKQYALYVKALLLILGLNLFYSAVR